MICSEEWGGEGKPCQAKVLTRSRNFFRNKYAMNDHSAYFFNLKIFLTLFSLLSMRVQDTSDHNKMLVKYKNHY